MAKGRLDAVLQHLGSTIHPHAAGLLTDRQLLDRFVRDRAEGAFAAVVRRHAALVLSVACRVLRDTHAAEDVFQATFLVLARKAGSIRRRPALAGWLYQVAYHLALKARAANARRQAHERRFVPMEQPAPDAGIHQRELRDLLDEELSRLPEKYRTPLVLHYLEGKSKQETARQLGWTEGTVSGRLARARTLLRSRLVRRGFALSSAALAAGLTENAATAVVPSTLVRATVDAAIAFAGRAVLGTLSARVANLAEGSLRGMAVVKIRNIAALALAVSVLATSAISYYAPADARELEKASDGQQATREQPEQAPGERGDRHDNGNAVPVRLSASGTVLNEQGKPIPGATVYLREMSILRDARERQSQGYNDIVARSTTDASGRFAFRDVAAPPMPTFSSPGYRNPWTVVVTAPGYGIAWHHFKSHRAQDLSFTLEREARLRGRLVDQGGRPAVGVRVQLMEIAYRLDPESGQRGGSLDHLELHGSRLPFVALTDSAGWFLLDRLPNGLHIGLLVTDARFARRWLNCATVERAEIDRLNGFASLPAELKLLPDGFTATLEPSGSVHGEIRYADTRQPAAGVRLDVGIYSTVTDRQGRYSLAGFDSQEYPSFVYPPAGTDYPTSQVTVSIPASTHRREQNFTLERGSVVTGQLREKETGKPLRVPDIKVDYRSEKPGILLVSARTRSDGSFRIVVPPGKGKLSTYDSVPGCVPDELLNYGFGGTLSEPFDIKPGQTLSGTDLLFLRGRTAHGRVLDMEGQPVSGARFLGLPEQAPSGPDGTFTLRGLSPDQESDFLVLDEPRGLGAKLTIPPPKDGSPPIVEVRLQRTRTATVRAVDEEGHPIAKARRALGANVTMREWLLCWVPVDASGRITLPALVVGNSYTVEAAAPGYARAVKRFDVQASKEPELLDLVLLPNRLSLTGVVLDPAGKPLSGIYVWIAPQNPMNALNSHSLYTGADGRFRFDGLPRGDYRLRATLWKRTGGTDKYGRPAQKDEASVELQFRAGQEDVRVILAVP